MIPPLGLNPKLTRLDPHFSVLTRQTDEISVAGKRGIVRSCERWVKPLALRGGMAQACQASSESLFEEGKR
jgi:hypothetical protein